MMSGEPNMSWSIMEASNSSTFLPLANTTNLRLTTTFMAVYYAGRIILSVLGLAGNTLTLVAVAYFQFLHAPANFLVCSLSVADLIGSLLTPLVLLHQAGLYDHPSYVTLCLTEKCFSIIASRGNFMTLFLLAADHYLYISRPLRYHQLATHLRTWLVIAATWCWILVETPLLVALGSDQKAAARVCVYFAFLGFIYRNYLIPQLAIFLMGTTVLYTMIAKIAIRQRKAIEGTSAIVSSTGNSGGDHKVVKMMSLVLGVYLLTYLPSAGVTIAFAWYPTIFTLQMEQAAALIFWSGICVNPFIYAWKSKEFRKAFKILLHLEKSFIIPDAVTRMST